MSVLDNVLYKFQEDHPELELISSSQKYKCGYVWEIRMNATFNATIDSKKYVMDVIWCKCGNSTNVFDDEESVQMHCSVFVQNRILECKYINGAWDILKKNMSKLELAHKVGDVDYLYTECINNLTRANDLENHIHTPNVSKRNYIEKINKQLKEERDKVRLYKDILAFVCCIICCIVVFHI